MRSSAHELRLGEHRDNARELERIHARPYARTYARTRARNALRMLGCKNRCTKVKEEEEEDQEDKKTD